MNNSAPGLRTMSLGMAPHDQLDFRLQDTCGRMPPVVSAATVSRLTKLSISCQDSRRLSIKDRDQYWESFVKSAVNLKELALCLGLQTDQKFFDAAKQDCKVVDHFLESGDFQHLRRLTIEGPKEKDPHIVDSKLLNSFLTRHAGALQHVEMSAILPSTCAETCSSDVHETFRSLLSHGLAAVRTCRLRLFRPCRHSDDMCSCLMGYPCGS